MHRIKCQSTSSVHHVQILMIQSVFNMEILRRRGVTNIKSMQRISLHLNSTLPKYNKLLNLYIGERYTRRKPYLFIQSLIEFLYSMYIELLFSHS